MRCEAGVVYRELTGFRPLELDLYLPDDPVATVVYLHGGGWRRGSRRHPVVPGCFERLVAEGFAVAAVDYRLSGEATFPAPLEDVLVALDHLVPRLATFASSSDAQQSASWHRPHAQSQPGLGRGAGTTMHSSDHRNTGQRLPVAALLGRPAFLLGESAGAHLALLAALTGSAAVRGVVAWFPPTDLLAMPGAADSREAGLLGAAPHDVPDLAQAASPVTHAHAAAPPVLLLHGDADDLVPAEHSVRMAEALRCTGAPVELELVSGARHMWLDADTESIMDRSVTFLRGLAT